MRIKILIINVKSQCDNQLQEKSFRETYDADEDFNLYLAMSLSEFKFGKNANVKSEIKIKTLWEKNI